MNDFFETAEIVYNKMGDDDSRKLYQALVMYQLTKEDSFFYDINGDNLNRLDINIYDKLLDGDKVIFGAGIWGRRIKNLYSDIRFFGFVDNKKNGETIDGMTVFSLDEMMEHVPNAQVIIAVKNNSDEIESQLIRAGVKKGKILNMVDIISEADRLFMQRQYFDLPYMMHDSEEVFVDVGAFDAMSSLNFVKWADGDYKKIYMFEANLDFHSRIDKKMKDVGAKYTLIPKGLWHEETQLTFFESPHDSEYNVNLDEHNCFNKSSENKEQWISHTIDVGRMDDYINERVTFIKMDIEGSEVNALRGAERIIKTYKPKLAISVYHKKDDLWTIPKLILEYNPNYRFYLRNYSFSFGESILYALPE